MNSCLCAICLPRSKDYPVFGIALWLNTLKHMRPQPESWNLQRPGSYVETAMFIEHRARRLLFYSYFPRCVPSFCDNRYVWLIPWGAPSNYALVFDAEYLTCKLVLSKPQQKWSSSVCVFGAVEKLSPEPVHIYVYAQVPPLFARKTHSEIVSCRVCVCAHSLERRRPDKNRSPTNQRGRQQRLQRDAKASP